MISHFDLEKLYRLLQDFYAICHIRTTVFTREVGQSPGAWRLDRQKSRT